MKNAILGTIANYHFNDIAPFALSLKNTGYTGELILFYRNVDQTTLEQLTSLGVTLIPFTDEFPYVTNPNWTQRGVVPAVFNRKLHVFSMRYIPYYLYLINCQETYDQLMLTDVRDVVFQKDPFAFPIDGQLCSFLEAENWPIEKSNFNGDEIRLGYGLEAYNQVKQELISCCGTTIEPASLIIKYLEQMISLILAGDGSLVLDQGTHNYILYTGLLGDAPIKHWKNHEGPVLTLGYEPKIYYDQNGTVTDKHGRVVNVVHQYDRHFWLAWRYYDWPSRRAFIKKWIKNNWFKKLNDRCSAFIKSKNPQLHHWLKKIKQKFS